MPPTNFRDAANRPLMLFDGDCGFCRFWVDRWRQQTGEAIDYEPYQAVDPHPLLAERDLGEAIHLIEPDGRVTRGAAAVFRARELGMDRPRLSNAYRKSHVFAAICEWSYRRVARNRPFFSCLTGLIYGRDKG